MSEEKEQIYYMNCATKKLKQQVVKPKYIYIYIYIFKIELTLFFNWYRMCKTNSN